MLNDAFRSDDINVDTRMNANAEAFYTMLHLAQQPFYEGSHAHTELSAAIRLLSIKSEHNMSNHCFDDVLHLMQEMTQLQTAFQKILVLLKGEFKSWGWI